MSHDVPIGWSAAKLGDTCDILIGGTPSRDAPVFWAKQGQKGHPWASISDLKEAIVTRTKECITDAGVAKSNVKLLPTGTVLMSFKLTIGRIAVAGTPLYTNEAIAGMIPRGGTILRDYLRHALPMAVHRVETDQAVKGKTLNKAKLSQISLLVPPLPEQRRIAEILSSVDEAIQATEAVIEQTRKVKDGVLERLMTKGIGHTEFKGTEIGTIPLVWSIESLGDIAEFVNGRGFKPHEWGMKGLPIIRIQNLNGVETFNYYQGTFAPKLVVSPGDLLFAWSGSRGTSFGPHIWNGPKGLLNYHTWRVRLFEPNDRDFIYFALRRLTRTIEADSHGASALVHMQKKAVVDYRIPFPPASERARITDILRGHDAAIKDIQNELASLRSTKSALMADLLTGRKRVNDTLDLAAE